MVKKIETILGAQHAQGALHSKSINAVLHKPQNTKQKFVADLQKIKKRELEYTNTEYHHFTKEGIKNIKNKIGPPPKKKSQEKLKHNSNKIFRLCAR